MLNHERRAFPRIKPAIPILVEVEGSTIRERVSLYDISAGGLRIFSDKFSPGEIIECRILVPDEQSPVLCASVVDVTSGKAGLELQTGKREISKIIDTLFNFSGLCVASQVHIEDGFIKVKGYFGEASAYEMMSLIKRFDINKIDLSAVASIDVAAVVACFQSCDRHGVTIARCSKQSFILLEESGFCNTRCNRIKQGCTRIP